MGWRLSHEQYVAWQWQEMHQSINSLTCLIQICYSSCSSLLWPISSYFPNKEKNMGVFGTVFVLVTEIL